MRTIYSPSFIHKAHEEKILKNGLIIFDTCGLLDFYYLIGDYQAIMKEILMHLKDRIWIPTQVKYEFDKNYTKARIKPISEKYNDKAIQKNGIIDDIKSYINVWEKKYYHPYISDDKLQDIREKLATLEPLMAEIKTTISREYQARSKEIKDIKDNDVIKECIESLNTGTPFSFNELKQIISEGSYRYKNLIPPGYKDAESKNGIRQYGDLIVWKEILRKAKESGRDVMFISNDLKADWRIVDETNSDSKAEKPDSLEIGKPRRELLTEFEEETGQKIWFYSSAEFIEKLVELFKPNQPQLEFYEKLEVVLNVMEQRDRERVLKMRHFGDSIFIRCNECGELFAVDADELEFNWEGGEVEDRSMGPENEYISVETCECPNCNDSKELTLHVWEYPLGAFNNQEIEIESGEIEKPIDLSDYISFDEYDTCDRCGEYAVLNEYGLCDVCQEEIDRLINSDD